MHDEDVADKLYFIFFSNSGDLYHFLMSEFGDCNYILGMGAFKAHTFTWK